MIKVVYLFWSLLIGLFTTLLSYFYVRDESLYGYPLVYFRIIESAETTSNQLIGQSLGKFSYLVFLLDLIFWWLILSAVLVIVKNYILDFEPSEKK